MLFLGSCTIVESLLVQAYVLSWCNEFVLMTTQHREVKVMHLLCLSTSRRRGIPTIRTRRCSHVHVDSIPILAWGPLRLAVSHSSLSFGWKLACCHVQSLLLLQHLLDLPLIGLRKLRLGHGQHFYLLFQQCDLLL